MEAGRSKANGMSRLRGPGLGGRLTVAIVALVAMLLGLGLLAIENSRSAIAFGLCLMGVVSIALCPRPGVFIGRDSIKLRGWWRTWTASCIPSSGRFLVVPYSSLWTRGLDSHLFYMIRLEMPNGICIDFQFTVGFNSEVSRYVRRLNRALTDEPLT